MLRKNFVIGLIKSYSFRFNTVNKINIRYLQMAFHYREKIKIVLTILALYIVYAQFYVQNHYPLPKLEMPGKVFDESLIFSA
jgi:hypothetical protein